MKSNQFVAVDLGSSQITVLAAEVQDDNAVRVLSDESKPSDDIRYGIVEQASAAAYKVNETIKLLHNSAKIPDIRKVSTAIGAKSMKQLPYSVTRYVGETKIVSADLTQSMKDEARRRISFPNQIVYDVIPSYYDLDGKSINDPVGQKGLQIIGYYSVIIGNEIIKMKLDDCFVRTGIELEQVPLTVEALSTAVLEDRDRNEGCALINFGATTSTLAIYQKGSLQRMLVVPLGGKNITKDIQDLGISEDHAERLKCIKGSALQRLVENPVYVQVPSVDENEPMVRISTEFLATIIEARLDEITKPILDVLTRLPYTLNGGIIITGCGAKLNNIIEFITDKTKIYTRIGDHSEWLTQDTPEKYKDIRYSQLIGTILLANEKRQEEMEEQPAELPEKKKTKPQKGRSITQKITQGIFKFFEDDANI